MNLKQMEAKAKEIINNSRVDVGISEPRFKLMISNTAVLNYEGRYEEVKTALEQIGINTDNPGCWIWVDEEAKAEAKQQADAEWKARRAEQERQFAAMTPEQQAHYIDSLNRGN